METQLRVAVVGLGNMGSAHAGAIFDGKVPGAVLAAVCDIAPARREWAAKRLPGVPVFDSYDRLLSEGTMGAVIIATPHYLHPPMAVAAFQQGLHVLTEKPGGVQVSAVERMCAAARESGRVFGVMFNQRTHPLFRQARQIVRSGQLGQLKRLQWTVTNWYRTQSYYDSGSWRASWAGEGGGVLLNQCPHQLDLLQWLCGLPVRVHSFCHEGKWHDIEVEDDVTAYMEFANGATGVFITTTADAPGTNRLEITGTKGRLICDENGLTYDRLKEDERIWCATCKEGFEKPGCERVEVETDGENPQHAGVLNAFAAHIQTGAPLVADGREGINGLMLSNAIHLSSWLGETVTLPIDEKKFLNLLNERRAHSRLKEDTDVVMDTASSYGGGAK